LTIHVAADTITSLTSMPDFARDIPPAPSKKELVHETRQILQHILEHEQQRLQRRMRATGGLAAEFSRAADRAQERITFFDDVLKNVPEGYRIVPVFYDTVLERMRQNNLTELTQKHVHLEFRREVKPLFLQHLAENHSGALGALGICAHGIERMRNGQDPVDKDGRFYPVSVDHIVERAGAGYWSVNKAVDPHAQPGTPPQARVNHFSNLILMPDNIHRIKNAFNAAQFSDDHNASLRRRWMLMLAPVRNERYSGYVSPPLHPRNAPHCPRAKALIR
jgi:hypothetical protein